MYVYLIPVDLYINNEHIHVIYLCAVSVKTCKENHYLPLQQINTLFSMFSNQVGLTLSKNKHKINFCYY